MIGVKAKKKELNITVLNGIITAIEGLDESYEKIKVKDYDVFTVTTYNYLFTDKKEKKLIE